MSWDRVDFSDSLAACPGYVRKVAAQLVELADPDGRLVASQRWLREILARRAGVPRDEFMRGFMALRQSGHLMQVRRGEGRGEASSWQLQNPNGQITTTTRPGGLRHGSC